MPGQKAPEETRREQILTAAYEVALRSGLDGVTVRAVAAEAALSHGLVVFYFKQKDRLIAAVLDRVLATALQLHVADDLERIPRAPDRLRALLHQELERLSGEPHTFRLFLECCALGARQPAVQTRIAAALERYRSALKVAAEAMLRADTVRQTEVTADGFAAIAVSLISGCAMQAMIDPDAFDLAAYLGAVKGVIEPLSATAPGSTDHSTTSPAPRSRRASSPPISHPKEPA